MIDIEQLADKYLLNELSPEERDALVTLLRDDTTQAKRFIQEIDQRNQIAEASRQVISSNGHSSPAPKRRTLMFVAVAAAVAAIAIAFLAWPKKPAPEIADVPAPESPAIARVIGMLNQPNTGEFPIIKNQAFAAGDSVSVKNGIVGIELINGVNLILEKNTIVVFDSPNQIYAKSGQLSVQLPPKVTEFRVITDTAKIVDRGTEFGVMIDSSGVTDVHVFRGKVGVSPAGSSAGEQLFERGRAVRATKQPELTEIKYTPGIFCSQTRRYPIKIHNTGVELDGKHDRHWRTTLPDSNQWHPTIHRSYRKGNALDNGTSKWIAYTNSGLPDNQLYTFETKFTTDTPAPARLRLSIRAMADDTIESVRLNGTEVWFPDAKQRAIPEPWTTEFVEINVDEFIPAGEHTLEFVTKNFIKRQPIRNPNDTGFRAEFNATLTRPRVRFQSE